MRLLKKILIFILFVFILITTYNYRFNIIDLFDKYKSNLQMLTSLGSFIDENEVLSLKDSGLTGEQYDFDISYYPYYGMLSENEKIVYKQVYATALEVESNIVPKAEIFSDELKLIMEAVYNDHPELFWLDTSYTYKYTIDNRCAQITIKYNYLINNIDEVMENFNNEVNSVISQAEKYSTNYEKEKFVHDYLVNSITYDKNASLNQTSYSALVNKRTVCAGYARAFQYIMTKLQISTYYCTGTSKNEEHAWNIVKLEDGYYNVDVTWDDNVYSKYNYFNKTDSDFSTTHIRSDISINLPICDAVTYRGYLYKNNSVSNNINSNNDNNRQDVQTSDKNNQNILNENELKDEKVLIEDNKNDEDNQEENITKEEYIKEYYKYIPYNDNENIQ